MKTESPYVRALLLEKFEALLDECDLVAQNAEYDQTLLRPVETLLEKRPLKFDTARTHCPAGAYFANSSRKNSTHELVNVGRVDVNQILG